MNWRYCNEATGRYRSLTPFRDHTLAIAERLAPDLCRTFVALENPVTVQKVIPDCSQDCCCHFSSYVRPTFGIKTYDNQIADYDIDDHEEQVFGGAHRAVIGRPKCEHALEKKVEYQASYKGYRGSNPKVDAETFVEKCQDAEVQSKGQPANYEKPDNGTLRENSKPEPYPRRQPFMKLGSS